MFTFSERSKSRMSEVHEDLIQVAHAALAISKVDFGIPEHGGLRSAEEQNLLFKSGASKADGFVNLSYHQTGKALDFYAIDPETGKASWDHELLFHVAAAFLQAAIALGKRVEWGGFFKSWEYPGDAPHIQLKE